MKHQQKILTEIIENFSVLSFPRKIFRRGRAIQTASAVFGELPMCRTVLTPLHSESALGGPMERWLLNPQTIGKT